MELTFVNQYAGDAPKRRRLAQACSFCRQRKKRCIHTTDAMGSDDSEPETTQIEQDESRNGDRRHSSTSWRRRSSRFSVASAPDDITKAPSSTDEPLNHTQSASGSGRARFVSDLAPESTLLDRPVPNADLRRRQPNDDIGLWIDRKEWEALTSPAEAVSQRTQKPHPTVIPPLIEIYFTKIHPILPLLSEQDFRREWKNNTAPEILINAMCLVAAKDTSAVPHLKLTDSANSSSTSTTVSARRFSNTLHHTITKALKSTPPTNKITLIRILALTSLHTQGPDGQEEASMHIAQAMHHAQTLGLHLAITGSVGKEAEMKRLFWCLWAMDRTNAVTNSRPVIMGDRDIAIEDFPPGSSGFPAFEAWLRVAQLLNKVIDFYRPTSDTDATGWEGDYPGLEEIIDEVGGWGLSASILATIHLFYLSVGILSHRTRGFRAVPRGIGSSIRQRLCAIEVVRLLTGPASSTSPPTALHPFPILPYAVSLALSVSYQHLRQSQLEHQQADAREDFRTCCALLSKLRRTWSSADIMATLAKKVLDQLDRAPSLASYRVPRTYGQGVRGDDAEADAPPGDLILPPSACVADFGARPGERTEAPTTEQGGNLATPGAVVEGDGSVVGNAQAAENGIALFDNMDDVFGTFMDPNYPLNLDDMSYQFPAWDMNFDGSVDS
ncbi:fungal-specific transcription factor domain-containing protein [Neohortaea acidophila]|uniref:Fungal-specific transcription factor domain-containing protein n=1 Tax=Neohortaea acidophila TaxID=245834 RepID=A0A6A6PGJ2_9PEZI|nr:fungal-specific transcription factor domain-containing protein [Neohortaea acidophila]KAF2478844.1 fungal-specific transcription factor domain-containing protein [Neohortaea acidophila]